MTQYGVVYKRRDAVAARPDRLRQPTHADPSYDVRISPGLYTLLGRLAAEHSR